MSHYQTEWRDIVYHLRETNPTLLNRIGRKMMNYLHKRKTTQLEDLMQLLTTYHASATDGAAYSDNRPLPRIHSSFLEKIIDEIFRIAAQELSGEEISHMLNLWLKTEQSRFLSMAAEKRDVALTEITDAVRRFMDMPDAQKSLSPEERIGVRVALIRRFFSDDLNYINTTKNHVSVSDFAHILTHVIGPAHGNGKLGGKAAGLFRAEKILMSAKSDNIILRNLSVPKTWYVTSDGILDFLHHNALEEMPTIKYRDPAEIRQEYPYVEQIFKNSTLPPELVDGLSNVLDSCADKPLVVRSSSLLEDMQGSSFAGKYKSLFVANQGTKQERLASLVDAILEVYASVFSPDPIEYRRERGLLDFNEEMAIMIQEVVGKKVGKYFLPAFAGVALSYNEFRMSPRMRRNDGIVRLVAGLGTRAVDRTGDDYPILVSPGQPGLRVNISPEDRLRYSQRNMDVINLESRRFETINFEQLVRELGFDYPLLSQIISMYHEGHFYDPVSTMFNMSAGDPVVTFANLIDRSPFIPQIKTILTILEDALHHPVDIEFASGGDVHSLYILQCRAQSYAGNTLAISIPQNITPEDQIFSANRYVTSGHVKNIEYIVYVDPFEYDAISTLDDLLYVGRVVGDLNSRLPHQKFILMGPGRWGSRGDIKLGVKVGYSDINNTAMLIEIARKRKGYVPDLSFGTHFFQDLVEAKILYLPLYPDEAGNIFNEAFLNNSPNILTKLIPAAKRVEKAVKVIHIPHVVSLATLSILMDGENDRALAFIKRNDAK